MKKFVIIPDSFKGTMTSNEICAIMKIHIQNYYPYAKIVSIPIADGGEGSVDSFLTSTGGEKIITTVKGPYMEDMVGFYGVLENGTAIIEMAACAGLPLVGNNKHPDQTTTYGVGQLIVHAVKHGCKKIVVGLGGSCTNDAGTGAAVAAGVKFYDKSGNEFLPTGATLANIDRMDFAGLCPEIKSAEIIAMCDIDNPFYGQMGAARVFSPQKGADEATVELLDNGLKKLSETIKNQLNVDVSEISGSGAAGGMGGGMVAFFGARLKKGIEIMLDTIGFDSLAKDADMVFTGEGKIDSQSLRGKVVIGVAQHMKKFGVPVIAIVGDIGDNIDPAYEMGVTGIFSINRIAVDFEESKERCKSDLALTMDNLLQFMSKMKL